MLTSCLFDAATNRVIPFRSDSGVDNNIEDPYVDSPVGENNIRAERKSICACNNTARSLMADYACIKFCRLTSSSFLSNKIMAQFTLGQNFITSGKTLAQLCSGGLNSCQVSYRNSNSASDRYFISINNTNFPTTNPNILVFTIPAQYLQGNDIRQLYFHVERKEAGIFQRITDYEASVNMSAAYAAINLSYSNNTSIVAIQERASYQRFRAKSVASDTSNPPTCNPSTMSTSAGWNPGALNLCQITDPVVKYYYAPNGAFHQSLASSGTTLVFPYYRIDEKFSNPTTTKPIMLLSMNDSNASTITSGSGANSASTLALNDVAAEFKKRYLGQTGDTVWTDHFFALPLPNHIGDNSYVNYMGYLPEFNIASLNYTIEQISQSIINSMADYSGYVGIAISPIRVGQSNYGNYTKTACPSYRNIQTYYDNIDMHAVSAMLGNPIDSEGRAVVSNSTPSNNWQIAFSTPFYLTCREPNNALKFQPADPVGDNFPEGSFVNKTRFRALGLREIFSNTSRYRLISPGGSEFPWPNGMDYNAMEDFIEMAFVTTGSQLRIRDTAITSNGESYLIVPPKSLVDPTSCAIITTNTSNGAYAPVYGCTLDKLPN